MVKKVSALICIVLVFLGCETDPLTGKKTLALYSDKEIFAMSFDEYEKFLAENEVITTGKDAEMVTRVGQNIQAAAEKWYKDPSVNQPNYLKDYRWEYKLVKDDQINAWCMPGGKIVIYTGILPVTQNEDALAVVMGHEVAHALLNHGRQRMSGGMLQQLGAGVLGLFTSSELVMGLYGVSTNLAGMLPFSRENETEADEYGLTLMTIAGYNPDEAGPFWERMGGGGSTSKLAEMLSTHPSSAGRSENLNNKAPEARQKASQIGIIGDK